MQEISIDQLAGFQIGHDQDEEGATGCTVILCKQGAVSGVDVRGGAPGTRETDLLKSENIVDRVHAVFFAGGSAYGLQAGGGVMEALEETEIGFETEGGLVPIVPGAILYDLLTGDNAVRPDAAMGKRAAQEALKGSSTQQGNVGAGSGASVGKCLGMNKAMKGGLGHFALNIGELQIGAVAVVNSFGDIIDPVSGERLAGAFDKEHKKFYKTEEVLLKQINQSQTNRFSGNTSLAAVLTNAKMQKSEANKLASIAHDGFAATMRPSHTFVDGDTIFVMSTNQVSADLNSLSYLASHVIEQAVLRAVRSARSLGPLLAYQDIMKE
ncbi:P1 family peptidase [Halobacillus sp. Marseille-Q1614]|uniref:P1 family peptidase n=1 Tax=Halobacillus sp. Marseille-Q1614 TaxID=2709134 RepID=UPI00157057A0|nr:P1 family peptidase [Halobacillus sp. Marseille-Q1614]